MYILKKNLIAVIVVTIICAVILYGTVYYTLIESSRRSEDYYIKQDMKRFNNILKDESNEFSRKWMDRSMLDKACDYIDSGNESYIRSNYNENSMALAKTNIVAIFNSYGKNIFFETYGAGKKYIDKSQTLKSLDPHLKTLFAHKDGSGSIEGFINLNDSIFLISSVPVARSGIKSGINGTVIAARMLDDKMIGHISDMLLLPSAINIINDRFLPSDFVEAKTELDKRKIFIKRSDINFISAFSKINDINGFSCFFIKIERPLINAGHDVGNINYMFLMFLICGIIIDVVTLALSKYYLLYSLFKFAGHNKEIKADGSGDEKSEIANDLRKIENLQKKVETSENANTMKKRFLANMAHEIKTPLNSIIGFSELMSKTGMSEEQKEYMGYIKMSGRELLSLTNDILDFSKIEAGKMDIEKVEFDVNQILWEVIGVMNPMIIKKGIDLDLFTSYEIKDHIIGDPARLKQVLLNLVSNAVKFTEKGKVAVSIVIKSETERYITLQINVVDEGIGIEAEKIKKIFSGFEQVDGSISRIYGGTGLGLTISNNLVKMMGGEKIFVESVPGSGSDFYFFIEFEKGSPLEKKQAFDPAASVLKSNKKRSLSRRSTGS